MTPDATDEISRLSNREADRVLAAARQARLGEIDGYWTLCHADPVRAERAAAASAPIVGDIFYLAQARFPVPAPGAVDGLSAATARLLHVGVIRDALLDESIAVPPADPADAFWSDGRVVAVKTAGADRTVVLRYDGPLFNPGTVPDSALAGGPDLHLVCESGSDGNGGDFESLIAYAIGSMDANGDWRPADMDFASRSDLMRDLPAMESLVERGRLGEDDPDSFPLPAFPSGSDHLIAQLLAHKARLRRQGAITPEQQAIVDRQTQPLHQRAAHLRQQMRQMEDELCQIRCRITDIEARALEEETGLASGDRIRHRFTGDEGTLEIVNFGSGAQFRLIGTMIYVTEDIRRGEWEKLDALPWRPPVS